MKRWAPGHNGRGLVAQSGMPTAPEASKPNGVQLRGVVVAVYVYDSTDSLDVMGGAPQYNAIYCDVQCYGRWNQLIRGVLWTSSQEGMHEGTINLPRKARLDISGEGNSNISNPGSLDGDHVIIGFLENDWSQPYVVRCIPHPSSDIGNASKVIGKRRRLTEADGEPHFTKHRGGFWGADDKGNFWIDMTEAHTGAYASDGAEPPPPADGNTGNINIETQAGTTLTIKLGTSHTITITESDGKLVVQNSGDTELNTDGLVKIGTGATHAIIHGDTYQTNMNTMNSQLFAAWQGLFTLFTGLQTLLTQAPTSATFALYAPAAAALYSAALTLMQTAGVAVQTFDGQIVGQLSTSVTSK